ncbi:DUF4136 domain-containing protein [Hymenobacter taeanensis]|uniref:DUF4136 domain-containing protein n=1 Tax=Hymenobacter taeanensis TaxID=2735321 RepID=A0A6M6BD76_9BACT|nr:MULTISPECIES: DUF4136 domain-containing protein [Hymenobacter]QJX46441.1 DUF4136 domain-containing protein [Hymenobacter taeanensis]UOQ80303.1 DUF4136 domain-containing protein [Hymenobacter sp. 5414T-23]
MNLITRFLSRRMSLAAMSLALLLGVSSCASTARVGVTNDFDHSINFRTYKTWAWYPEQPTDSEGGPAQGYQSFLDKRIRTAVEREMTAKGLTRVDKAPDLYVAYSAKVEEKQRATNNGLYSPYGYPYYGYGYGGFYNRNLVTDYKAGTVIIDFVDANRKELAWRGQGQAQVDNQTISEEEVYRIVGSILGTYPPQDQQASR